MKHKNKENEIIITQFKSRFNGRSIKSKSDFFLKPITYKVEYNCLIFKHVFSEYRGKTVTPGNHSPSNNNHNFLIYDENIPLGVFEIDEDSTEDELIVYFK